jgi:glutamate--cysteine ligase
MAAFRRRGATRGGNLTVEPGGQLEYSTAPHRGLVEIERELTGYLARLRDTSARCANQFLAIGFDPICSLDQQQWFPKPRYDIMRPYLAGQGARAWDMMTRTCATQVSDFRLVEDLLRKFSLGNRFAVCHCRSSPILPLPTEVLRGSNRRAPARGWILIRPLRHTGAHLVRGSFA